MARFRFTRKAVGDLNEIWNFTAEKWSENQADLYYRLLIESCREIALQPDSGEKYPGVAKNLRGFKTGRHIIFYQIIDPETVLMIRILHDQMDLRNRLR
jgi:toxin ParE1/3/4